MKVIIGPDVGGFSLPKALVRKLFQTAPQLFDEPLPVELFYGGSRQSPEAIEASLSHCVTAGEEIFFLREDAKLRTYASLVALVESGQDPELKHLKVVVLPADVRDWYVFKDDDLSEEVHEVHRVWS